MAQPIPGFKVRFGVFELDTESGELRKSGSRVRLQDQPLKVLTVFLENPGRVVTRDELKRRIWPNDSFGDFDHAVNIAVAKVRDALTDSADAPRYIETLPRRGYRFICPVSSPDAYESTPAAGRTRVTAEKAFSFRWSITASTIVCLVLGVIAWQFLLRSRHAMTEKDTVVLADFTNSTGDPVFDGTLRQGLSVQLEQSPFLSLVSEEQIQQTLQLMGQKPDAKLTPSIAREVCQRRSAAAMLEGSIAQVGARYLLTVKAVNCSNGQLLTSTEAHASDKDHVLDALGKAALETRKKLGESLASIQKFNVPLEQVTTSSLEALKTFSIYAHAGGLVPPFPMLLHVIELDPNFADAYAQLADAYSDTGESELASDYAQKAFERREHVSERERLSITSKYYFYTLGDLDQELRTYRLWEQVYPRDWGPWNDAAGNLRMFGEHERALREAQEALRLNADAVNPYVNVAAALFALERKEEGRQIGERALAHGIDVPATRLIVYQAAFLQNDTKEMEVQLAPLLGGSARGVALEALMAQSSTEAFFGRLRSSLEFSEQALEMARRNKYQELAAQLHAIDALHEAEFGHFGQAVRTAHIAHTLSSGRNAKLFTSLALARIGQVRSAQALADELDRRFQRNTLMQGYWLPTIRGAIELSRNNPSKALSMLRGMSYEFSDTLTFLGNLYPAYVRGLAYLDLHRGQEAAAEFQKLLDHRSLVSNSPLGALANLGLARAYSLQRETVKARVAYEAFLALWKNADPDIPVLKQAKAEYAKLQ
jgi:eukaryotic-like serine/threonine-protein kinase